MQYRVLSPLTYRMDLGVLAYIDGGEVFTHAVDDVLLGLHPFGFPITKEDTPESLFSVIMDELTTASAASPRWSRVYVSQLNEFLFRISKEIRRWKFTEQMDAGIADAAVWGELEPIAQIAQCIKHHQEESQAALEYFTHNRFAINLATLAIDAFGDAMTLFDTVHRNKVTGMRVKINTRNYAKHVLEMKLLIEVEDDS